MKPTILMDVDGVLAPYGPRRTRNPPGMVQINGKPFPKRMGRLLQRLQSHYPILYVSTWNQDTRLINQTFGLQIPYLPVPVPPGELWRSAEVKARVVTETFTDRRALLWFDDRAGEIRQQARRRQGRTTFVIVPGYHGLTQALVNQGLRLADVTPQAA